SIFKWYDSYHLAGQVHFSEWERRLEVYLILIKSSLKYVGSREKVLVSCLRKRSRSSGSPLKGAGSGIFAYGRMGPMLGCLLANCCIRATTCAFKAMRA